MHLKCVTGAICDPSNIWNMLVCVNTGDRRDKIGWWGGAGEKVAVGYILIRQLDEYFK